MATAWRSIQRNMARLGLATGHPTEALELARALAMTTYRSPEEFAARFRKPPRMETGRPVFPVEEYLQARGRDYAARNRPESFICLSESIDLHQVDASAHRRAHRSGGRARGPARAHRRHARADRAPAGCAACTNFPRCWGMMPS